MNRLQKIFSSCKTALVIFDSCGAPSPEESERRLETIVANGADIVELGVPFSDPMADGPTIQRASLEALRHGTDLAMVLGMARRLREKHPDTGIILFGYFNVFLQFDLERFAAELEVSGVDGVLVVDLPFEERDEFLPICCMLTACRVSPSLEIPMLMVGASLFSILTSRTLSRMENLSSMAFCRFL